MENNYSQSQSYNQSDDIRLFGQSFLKAKLEFKSTGKSAKHGKGYKYATLDDVYEAVEVALLSNDIAIWHYNMHMDTKMFVVTRLTHVLSGQWIQDMRLKDVEYSTEIIQHIDFTKNDYNAYKNQAEGSKDTYFRRYALLCLCGIAPEDYDGEVKGYDRQQATSESITQDQALELKNILDQMPIELRNEKVAYLKQINRIGSLTELGQDKFTMARGHLLKTLKESK